MNARLNIRHFIKNMDILLNHKIDKALKSDDPFVELDELFQQTIANKINGQYMIDKAINILERAYEYAVSKNNKKKAFHFLFKIANFYRHYDRYPVLAGYAIEFKHFYLVKALIDEVKYRYNEGSVKLNLVKELSDVLLTHSEDGHSCIKYALPLVKHCNSKDEYISILFRIAKDKFDNRKYDQAKDYYLEILNNRVRTKDLFEALAHIYIKENKIAYSLRYFEEALKLNSENKDLLLYFATYHYNSKDYTSAKSLFLLYDALDPEYMKGKDILADIYMMEKNYDDAIFYIQQLSDYYIQNDNIKKASEFYNKLIENCKDSVQVRMAYINFLESVGDYNAVKEQNLAIGEIYLQNNDLDNAFDHFVLLQDLANAQGDYFYQQKILGFIYQIQLKNNDYMNAIITLHSLLNVCREINDIRAWEHFKRELVMMEARQKAYSNSYAEIHSEEPAQERKEVISDLRNLANQVLEINRKDIKEYKTQENGFYIRGADSRQERKIIEGIKLRRNDRLDDAKRIFIDIIKEKREIPAVYPQLFHIFLKENDLIACKKVISTALKINHLTLEEKSLFLLLFGYIFFRMEDYEKALKYYKLCYNLNDKLNLLDKMDYIYRKNEEKKIEIRVNKMLDPLMK